MVKYNEFSHTYLLAKYSRTEPEISSVEELDDHNLVILVIN